MNNKKIKALDLCGSGPPRRHGSDRLWASSGHGDGRLSADSAPVLAGRRRAAGAGGGRRRGARGLRLPTDQVSLKLMSTEPLLLLALLPISVSPTRSPSLCLNFNLGFFFNLSSIVNYYSFSICIITVKWAILCKQV